MRPLFESPGVGLADSLIEVRNVDILKVCDEQSNMRSGISSSRCT